MGAVGAFCATPLTDRKAAGTVAHTGSETYERSRGLSVHMVACVGTASFVCPLLAHSAPAHSVVAGAVEVRRFESRMRAEHMTTTRGPSLVVWEGFLLSS